MKKNNSILSIIPNVLTLFRSLAAIILPIIIIYGDEIGALIATPILILAGISDYFDGFFARKYNVTSNFGKVLDPIADKLLIITVCVLIIIYFGKIIGLVVIAFYIIIIREIIVSLLRFNLVDENKSIDVSLLSKYKTFIQMIAIGCLIIIFVGFELPGNLVAFSDSFTKFFIWLSAFITVITGIQHYKTYLRLKK